MANTTSLNYADLFPAVSGWLNVGQGYQSSITLNGGNLSSHADYFPLIAKTTIYQDGQALAHHYSPEINIGSFETISLNEIIQNQTLLNGYYEVTVYPTKKAGLKQAFYNEVWGSVVSGDGKTALNYPLLITRGASPPTIDASTLYYPGITINNRESASVLVLNNQDFINNFEIILFDSSGECSLTHKAAINPKSVQNIFVHEIFPQANRHLKDKPGLLVLHYQYKLNAFIQTHNLNTGICAGMDHMGVFFGDMSQAESTDQSATNAARESDRLICYCKSLSEKNFSTWKDMGLDLACVMKSSGAGAVCQGCIPDLEKIFKN